jgi:hypothetical protein
MKMGETDSADKFMVWSWTSPSVLIETMRREELQTTTSYYQRNWWFEELTIDLPPEEL